MAISSGVVGADVRLVRGRERVEAITQVMQRARLADPSGGVWEAADLQWWWRQQRPTDEFGVPVWEDQIGPCAAVNVMDCLGRAHADRDGRSDDSGRGGAQWQVDLLVVPGTVDLQQMWSGLAELIEQHRPALIEIVARDDDQALTDRLTTGAFIPFGEPLPIVWMDTANRTPPFRPAEGFRIVDRASKRADNHHWGSSVEARLNECSLYDPRLDLAMIAPNGEVAGYALFWADLVTGVGMLEPMRVNDAYQRQGLAKALLTSGLDRLAQLGTRRIKVTFARYAGRDLQARGAFTTTGSARMWKSEGKFSWVSP